MNAETKLNLFINNKVPKDIQECIEGVFEVDTDPEISFKLLRGLLIKLKKEHKQLYYTYLESDDSIEAPESSISKHRKSNVC